MVKLAWPSLLAHSSLGSESMNGAASPETVREVVLARGRLIEAMEGLDDSGGEGIPANRDSEHTVYFGESLTLTSATEGDWSGD